MMYLHYNTTFVILLSLPFYSGLKMIYFTIFNRILILFFSNIFFCIVSTMFTHIHHTRQCVNIVVYDVHFKG